MLRARPVSKSRFLRATAIAIVLALLSFAGCATKRDVVIAKVRGRGTERVYPVTVDQAWLISKAILSLEPTEKIDEHKSEGYMLTSDDSSALTPSTYMGVFIERDGPVSAKVTFVTRRRTPTQSFASLTEGTFHRKFAELVELIASVGPLPREERLDAGDGADTSATPPEAGETGRDGGRP
jgi:hypothetical protein